MDSRRQLTAVKEGKECVYKGRATSPLVSKEGRFFFFSFVQRQNNSIKGGLYDGKMVAGKGREGTMNHQE